MADPVNELPIVLPINSRRMQNIGPVWADLRVSSRGARLDGEDVVLAGLRVPAIRECEPPIAALGGDVS